MVSVSQVVGRSQALDLEPQKNLILTVGFSDRNFLISILEEPKILYPNSRRMIDYKLDELERAVCKRNPLLADRLNSPLSDSDVKMMLKRAKVVGALDPVVALYTWKNGTIFDQALMISETGFFPGAIYQFIDIKKAIEHMKGYRECVSCFPKLANLGNRYFPVFWNGSTNWIGLNLDSSESPVVLIRFFVNEASFKDGQYEEEVHETEPPRQAYDSFQEFIADAIHANENDEPLACMREP